MSCPTKPNIDPKRVFWLFAGDEYYPAGGIDDLVATFDTLEDAARTGRHHDNVCRLGIDRRRAEYKERWQWWHILDTTTGEVHAEGARTSPGPPLL
jgi:hypothetical protein